MTPQLTHSHQRTYDCVSRHPIVRNPGWRDVRSMLRSLAEASRAPNGNLEVTRNGQMPDVHAPLDNNLDEECTMFAALANAFAPVHAPPLNHK